MVRFTYNNKITILRNTDHSYCSNELSNTNIIIRSLDSGQLSFNKNRSFPQRVQSSKTIIQKLMNFYFKIVLII